VNGYVAAGYGLTLVTLALYALRVVRRGRALARAARERQ
jgi:heme exporter protein D